MIDQDNGKKYKVGVAEVCGLRGVPQKFWGR